ncbi:MAG: hypothetical protein EOO17_02775 [Chloroflexi bacterium]|nr:MAG: hypothetical protein EOO17_02775 [Chloroflexota bacterium]
MNETIKKLRDTAQQYVQRVYTPNRSIALGVDMFTVKMKGLNAIASLHKASSFSYRDIESVSAGPADVLTITLRQHPDDPTKFDMIQMQVDNPHELVSQISQRIE